jgi:hypothetical protein
MIRVDFEGAPELTFDDLWPRSIAIGEARGYCGADVIIGISRVFTPEEDLLYQWINEQDGSDLFGIQHLSDGRDLIIFNRTFTKQTREAAEREHRIFLREVIHRFNIERGDVSNMSHTTR